MNVTIRDSKVLNTLKPTDMVAYLRASGWQRESDLDGNAELWISPGSGKSDVLVPLRRAARDYALRASEFLKILEDVEGRSQQEIFDDIEPTSSDVIRLRTASSEAATSGTISLDSGVVLFEEARDLVLAAACATVQPKTFWARRRPPKAVEFMKGIRLGQTERGSYVVTIQSPVSPALRTEIQPEQPFERRVIETLSQSLSALQTAARQANSTGDMKPFQESVDLGISANLCDSVVRLFEAGLSADLDVTFSWSRNRPSQNGPVSSISLSSEFKPVIEEASRLFKQSAPEDDFELIGFVERLDRDMGAETGQVFVNTLMDERPRRVAIELSDPAYQVALTAHGDTRPVSCTGELVKTGRSYELRNPRDFRLLDVDFS